MIRGFLATRPGWRVVPGDEAPENLRPLIDEEGQLRLLPHHHDMDGFFAVRLQRGEPSA